MDIQPYYHRQAKDLVNLLFDKRFLADDLTRQSIDWLEDYLALILQQIATSAAKAEELLRKIETRVDP